MDRANARMRKRGKHVWYAWRPVKMLDGRWIWLERVMRIHYMDSSVPARGSHHTIIGFWCFKPLGSFT